MKVLFSKFNTNWIAVGILFSAFVYSAFRFYMISQELSNDNSADAQKIIRITHWQLEPGFREALEWVINEYNSLPKVEAAGLRVIQAPIPQPVYNQFMNVHLISGTAPDIAVKGGTELIKGNALAKFYAPLGSYVEDPNPYNAPEYLSPDLEEDYANFLSNSPWRDTFFDGLIGGYDSSLSDYYGIPITATGGLRIFYNLDLLHKVKAFTLSNSSSGDDPEWLRKLWRTNTNKQGYLPRESGITWLKDSSIPQTLGQFYLYCNAVQQYALATDNEYLVPIASSNYPHNDFADEYKQGFLSGLNRQQTKRMDGIEILASYERGQWSFQSPEFQEFFNMVEATAAFYPKGYLGLDREQAQRRFVLGMAAIIRTGGWDASSILSSIAKRDDPKDHFKVEIAAAPLPAEDERWGNFLSMRVSEAGVRGVAPFAINKQCPHPEWALDFLKFATSHRINQEFAKRAGWLPICIGAEPPKSIAAFSPLVEGFPKQLVMDFADGSDNTMPTTIKSAWKNNLNLFASGDLNREQLVKNLEKVLESPNIGIPRAWLTRHQKAVDQARAYNRSVTIERLIGILGSESAAQREKATLSINLTSDEGIMVNKAWHDTHPDKPFPTY